VDNPAVLITALLVLLGCGAGAWLALGALYSWSLPDLNPEPSVWEE
jgi:hypothetical protein